ncbi:hypothetical protein [Parachitinimonas caeni]|uniref:Uncharacterized protein n=1 Tax=Parachitinimonas caeni TaxID=3031301 RepID=A0ABT7DRY0_9NEIS|nr:hypothetical protein [Parachitinimonas caeni]MDK2122823.1 hypothetical protein [Parachitinimonas caeni]
MEKNQTVNPPAQKTMYGVAIKQRKEVVAPVAIDLDAPQGSRVVMSSAKRVAATHAEVIKRLADR